MSCFNSVAILRKIWEKEGRKNVLLDGLFGTLTKIAEVFHPDEKLPLLILNRRRFFFYFDEAFIFMELFILTLPPLPVSKESFYLIGGRRFL